MRPIEQIREQQHQRLQAWLAPLVGWLAARAVHPNLLTAGNVIFSLLAAWLVINDQLVWAGIVFLFGSALDMLDGMLARFNNQVTPFGGFLDSTLDRVCEGAIFAAIAWWLAAQGHAWAVAALVLAMLGSMLTSYTRARAEALGLTCNGGWITRAERVILLCLGLITHQLELMAFVLAVLALWTAGQRIHNVYKHLPTEAEEQETV